MEASVVMSASDAQARKNAAGMKGWLKLVGVVTIIGGCLQALSIVGLLFAWLPIWLGVILTQAGSRADDYASIGDMASLEALTGKLKSYFMVSGIVTIISLALGVIGGIIVAVVIIASGFSLANLGDILNQFNR